MTYHLFIGRWQSPHRGHMTLFDRYLSLGQPVCIAIRDIAPDEQNPLGAEQVRHLWETVYRDQPLVKVIIIPDIASVNYGRGVGYEVRELEVSPGIAAISATEIRRQIRSGETGWQELVDPSIHETLRAWLTDTNPAP
jgi:nicotinamide mononucleotide adenylyltransferase